MNKIMANLVVSNFKKNGFKVSYSVPDTRLWVIYNKAAIICGAVLLVVIVLLVVGMLTVVDDSQQHRYKEAATYCAVMSVFVMLLYFAVKWLYCFGIQATGAYHPNWDGKIYIYSKQHNKARLCSIEFLRECCRLRFSDGWRICSYNDEDILHKLNIIVNTIQIEIIMASVEKERTE